MIQREAVKEMVDRKNQLVAAVYSNPTWDEPDLKDDRVKYLASLENHFDRAIEEIYKTEEEREAERKAQEIDWDNPFWQASLRARGKMLAREDGDGTVEEISEQEEREARERRARLKKQIDQA